MGPKASSVAARLEGLASAIPAGVAEATVVLLRNLIDYAGLFPPASLGMERAVANYAAYLKSDHSWMLGRFILPAVRLGEFEGALGERHDVDAGEMSRWGLSVLLGADLPGDLLRIREFNARGAGGGPRVIAHVESVEVKVGSPEEIKRLAEIIPAELETYFEIPLSAGLRDCIAAIAACGRRAKIRTGGETADKFPAPQEVLEFIELCVARGVGFKATAGLHHPVRSVHRLTYQPDSPSGMMHGFLNIFLDAAFLRAGMESRLALQLLNEENSDAFRFDSGGVAWHGHQLSLRELVTAREGFSVSFGSCSFTEPLEDLRALQLL